MANLTTKDRLKTLLPELFSEKKVQGDSYLRLQLSEQLFVLIDLNQVQESFVVPGREITTVPNVPEYVLGLMTSRGEVFLALDFAHLIGLPPEISNCRQYQVIVVKTSFFNQQGQENSEISDDSSLLGLVVNRILGVSRFVYDDFGSSLNKDIPKELSPFVYGSINHQEDQYLVLDIKSLIKNKLSENN